MEALTLLAKDFFETDWKLVEFGNATNALYIGLVFIGLLIAKVIIGRKLTKSREVSGHFIKKPLRQGHTSKFVYLLPKIIIAIGVFFLLFAYADPFTSRSSERELVDSRERIELIDVSPSMGFQASRSKESLAAIVRRQHVRFLDMRRGMNDRVALWLFTDKPYRMEGFIEDDDVYKMQVVNSPWVIVDKRNYKPFREDPSFVAPPEKIHYITYSGGTNLILALRATLDYLSEQSDIRIERKAILLVTDAAANVFPEDELREVRRRGISLYMLFIKPAPRMFEMAKEDPQVAKELNNSKEFIDKIVHYGGKYFEVTDEESLSEIFSEINSLESIQIQKMRHATRNHIYFQPLAVAMLLLILGVLLALALEVLMTERP